ncbi:E1-E2 ATPase domain-containing protein [Trichoderma sp. SZMC 28014]
MSLLTSTYSSLSTLLLWFVQLYNTYHVPESINHYYSIFVSVKTIEHLRDEKWAKNTVISAILLSAVLLSSLYCTYFSHFKTLAESLPEFKNFSTTISLNDPFLNAIDYNTLDLSHLVRDGGLSEHEVLLQRNRFGSNVLYHNRDWLQVFFTFCRCSNSVINEASIIVSVLQRERIDVLVLCVAFCCRFYTLAKSVQDYDDFTAAIGWDLSTSAVVLRGNKLDEINITDIVPGDVVHLSQGCAVPADVRLISPEAVIRVDHSAITGRREFTLRRYGDMCWPTGWVMDGDAFAYVVATGRHSFLNRFLEWGRDPAPNKFATGQKKNQKQHLHILQYLSLLQIIGIIFLVFIVISIGTIFLHQEFMTSLTPARNVLGCVLGILTILNKIKTIPKIDVIRTIGAGRLADNNIVVHDENSVECLAGVDIVCTDNSGTVSETRLSVQEPYCINCNAGDIILTAYLAAGLAQGGDENPNAIDVALLRALKRYPEAKGELNRCGILDTSPFNPETKRTSASIELPTGERIICYKGAPLYILQYVLQQNPTIPDDVVDRYENSIKEATKQGWRTLGVARGRDNGKMELLGFIPFSQPLSRYDSAASIQLAKSLGVSVKLITGSPEPQAAHTMKLVGLSGEVLSCGDGALRLNPDPANADIYTHVEAVSGFAEVLSEDKEQIVRILQSREHIVAVTGDEYKDSPALKMANCGIAVNGACNTARCAADMVQVNEGGLASMLQAIQISRQTLEQSYNYLVYETVVVLQCIGLWLIWNYKFMTSSDDPLSLWWLILHLELAGMMWLGSLGFEANTLFLNKPSTWKRREFLILIVSVYITFALGLFARTFNSSSILALARVGTHGSFAKWSAQNIWLFSIITGHPQYCGHNAVLVRMSW